MTERYLIHVGGSPGSGKSRMARELVVNLQNQAGIKAEHFSVGEHVRLLARGAISSSYRQYVQEHLDNPITTNEPLDEDIIKTLLYNIFDEVDGNVNVMLLDGYPRYVSQTVHYRHLAREYGYRTPGALIAETTPETAMARMIKRSIKHPERQTSLPIAQDKLERHQMTFPGVLAKLGEYASASLFEPYFIDTSGQPEETDARAFEATMRLMSQRLPRSA